MDIGFVLTFRRLFRVHVKAMIVFLNMKYDNIKKLMEVMRSNGVEIEKGLIAQLEDIHREDFDDIEGKACKKSQEIFPSQLGFEMPYKSKLKQSYKSTTYNNYRNSIKKELSKDKNRGDNNKNNNEKNEQKTYYSYKSSIKSDNPFKGQSKYEKSNKQRKNEIAKTVEKEENEFYDIAVIEEKISNKSQLNEEEINQLINRFSNIM